MDVQTFLKVIVTVTETYSMNVVFVEGMVLLKENVTVMEIPLTLLEYVMVLVLLTLTEI